MILIYLLIGLLCFYSMLLVFYRSAWMNIPVFNKNSSSSDIFFSVIIPARNEEKNIGACLESVLGQDYKNFEVIVVDDHSTDQTTSIIRSFNNDKLRLIQLDNELNGEIINSYKKKGIETAIAQAKGNWIVTTDADCIVQQKWLSVIAAFQQQEGSKFIAAPVSFYQEDSFIKIFQSLDFMTLQGITGASVYKRFHNMCNGANLAYEKKVFEEVSGFKGIDNIASGDDMLLMQKISKKYPEAVHYLKSNKAIVQTLPVHNWKEFFQQRIRWASKASYYEDKRIFSVLLLVFTLNFFFLLLALDSLFSVLYLYWFIFLLLVKTVTELIFLAPVAKFFSKTKLLWWFFFAQPIHIIYTVVAGFLGKFGSYEWKGRTVK